MQPQEKDDSFTHDYMCCCMDCSEDLSAVGPRSPQIPGSECNTQNCENRHICERNLWLLVQTEPRGRVVVRMLMGWRIHSQPYALDLVG